MLIFPDGINFHARNFPALYRVLQSDRIPVRYVRHGDDGLKRAFGHYDPGQSELQPYLRDLGRRPPASLREHEHRGVRLLDVCKYELLQHLMLMPEWYDHLHPNDEEVLFEEIARRHGQVLLLNLAAAAFWVDFWQEQLGQRTADARAVGLFGNSLSYTRAISGQAARLDVLPVVFEHFFTGHDHYMEVRKGPIQGFSELRLALHEGAPCDAQLVYRRLAEMQNKNVQQGTFRRTRWDHDGRRRILLLGQVVNDFAAVSPANRQLGTIALYKKLIAGILDETDVDLVIKTHPYEAKKTGGRGPITHDALRAFVASRGPKAERRVRLVQDYPLASLFQDVSLVVTLHSQGALEAVAHGLPVATLGNPFYGHKGFTSDYDDPHQLVEALAGSAHVFELGEEQRARFLTYMTHCFHALVNRHESRDRMLDRLAAFGVFPAAPHVPRPNGKPRKSSAGVGVLGRKARKFVRNPKIFFADALHNLARKL